MSRWLVLMSLTRFSCEAAKGAEGSVLSHHNVRRLQLKSSANATDVWICGTAHALDSSKDLARQLVREVKPDV
eukprot:10955139-Alexandrium_andersonii.AAC.1